jgi:hypothetical protein
VLLDDLGEDSCVFNGGDDLSTVPDNTLVLEETLDLPFPKGCHPADGKTRKSVAKGFSLVKHQTPSEACLKDLKNESLKKGCIIFDRTTPLLIVVTPQERVLACPRTTATIRYVFARFTGHSDLLRQKQTPGGCTSGGTH